jgi:hypothetical protein
MDNLIRFPLKNKRDRMDFLVATKKIYLKAGLSEQGADAALEELESTLEPFTKGYESVFELSDSAGLTQAQIELITEAHNKYIKDLFAHFNSKLGYAACTIAGLIGSKHASDG